MSDKPIDPEYLHIDTPAEGDYHPFLSDNTNPVEKERVLRDLRFVVNTEKGIKCSSTNIYTNELPKDFKPYIPYIKASLGVESVEILSAQIFNP